MPPDISFMGSLWEIGKIAIGSAGGFIFGLFAFHYQQKRVQAAQNTERQQAAYDAVDRLAQSAALNIEAVAIVKNMLGPGLDVDSKKMSDLKDQFNQSNVRDKIRIVSEMKDESSSLEHFFILTQRVTGSPFPPNDQYAAAIRKAPILNLLAFRSESLIIQTNEMIDKHNNFIESYSENGGSNMAVDRYLYFISMLSDSGQAIGVLLDDCLAMLGLVFDQANKYLEGNAEGGRSHKYQIAPNALIAMPPAGRFETLEEQIVEFDRNRC